MKPVLDIRPVRLPARSTHRMEGGKGLEVTAISGAVWVTQARDPRDMVLAPGQSLVLDRKGLAVAYALRDAAIIVAPAGHIAHIAHKPTAAHDEPDHDACAVPPNGSLRW